MHTLFPLPHAQFLLEQFEVHPASGGLSLVGFCSYFESALAEDFDDTLADLRVLHPTIA